MCCQQLPPTVRLRTLIQTWWPSLAEGLWAVQGVHELGLGLKLACRHSTWIMAPGEQLPDIGITSTWA